MLTTGASNQAVSEVRTFRTATNALQELARWLRDAECPTVALESTGVDWKPVFNILEPAGWEVVLCNAQHVKNVPGRKTVVKDARGLATAVEAGWAASRSKNTSRPATYHRLAGRRGGQRACLAVGHRIPRMAHSLLTNRRSYEQGGRNHHRVTDTDRLKENLVRRLRKLGFAITVTGPHTAA